MSMVCWLFELTPPRRCSMLLGVHREAWLMSSIIGAHHTSFTVANIDASVAFFRDRLGLTLLGQREIANEYFGRIVGLPGARVRAALLRIAGSNHHVELFQYVAPAGATCTPRPCDPGSSHLALLVEDLPALFARLRTEDVDF